LSKGSFDFELIREETEFKRERAFQAIAINNCIVRRKKVPKKKKNNYQIGELSFVRQ